MHTKVSVHKLMWWLLYSDISPMATSILRIYACIFVRRPYAVVYVYVMYTHTGRVEYSIETDYISTVACRL